MAKKVVYMDDLEDGVEADAGTVSFAIDGTPYEIDLSQKNATKLRAFLGLYTAAARVAAKGGKRTTHTPSEDKDTRSGYNSDQLKAIREWAGRNGFTLSDRGRVPKNVIQAFEAANAPVTDSPAFSAV